MIVGKAVDRKDPWLSAGGPALLTLLGDPRQGACPPALRGNSGQ